MVEGVKEVKVLQEELTENVYKHRLHKEPQTWRAGGYLGVSHYRKGIMQDGATEV